MTSKSTLDFRPSDPPRLLGGALGSAVFKSKASDFQVDELLGFTPSGDGEHCLAWIEKIGRNTNEVATEIAKVLGVRKRLISHCGLKDKSAVTRQWFSLHLPGKPSPELSTLRGEGWRTLSVTRNLRKLHRGSHDGNRFTIRLCDCEFAKEVAEQRWDQISRRGVPNYFGPQRFGIRGQNVPMAIEMMTGETTVEDRALRGILISAARSYLFNAFVGDRVAAGCFERVLDGEVFGFANNRSLVLPDNLHGDEAERVARGELELTAPLWGDGELASRGEVFEREQSVVANYPRIVDGLKQFNLRQERRVMKVRPSNPSLAWEDDTTVVLRFDLPKGTYATTVLRELADLRERP